jgi:hypothetical protein
MFMNACGVGSGISTVVVSMVVMTTDYDDDDQV